MVTNLAPKLALTSVAAIALYIPTLGLLLPGSCERTASVASAAPSPTCASDLRECLRLSAKQGLYGVRYVTADDVSRCMEAFNACTHGTLRAGGNPNPSASTSTGGDADSGLPQRFGIKTSYGSSDCTVSGSSITCTETLTPLPSGIDSLTRVVHGTLAGRTVTGTATTHQKGHYENGCLFDETYTDPVTYVLAPGGDVTMTFGVGQRQSTFSCAEPTTGTTPAGEATGTWSAIG